VRRRGREIFFYFLYSGAIPTSTFIWVDSFATFNFRPPAYWSPCCILNKGKCWPLSHLGESSPIRISRVLGGYAARYGPFWWGDFELGGYVRGFPLFPRQIGRWMHRLVPVLPRYCFVCWPFRLLKDFTTCGGYAAVPTLRFFLFVGHKWLVPQGEHSSPFPPICFLSPPCSRYVATQRLAAQNFPRSEFGAHFCCLPSLNRVPSLFPSMRRSSSSCPPPSFAYHSRLFDVF